MLLNSVKKHFKNILVHFSKVTIIILSVFGLFYQIYPVYQTFKNANTVVTVDISDNFDYVPSFTICYDKKYNLHSLSYYNATFKKMYDELLSYFDIDDSGFYVYKNYSNISNEKLRKLTKIYDKYEEKAKLWYIQGNYSDIDPVELFDNITIPFYKYLNGEYQTAIKIYLNHVSLTHYPELRPIESFMNMQYKIQYDKENLN